LRVFFFVSFTMTQTILRAAASIALGALLLAPLAATAQEAKPDTPAASQEAKPKKPLSPGLAAARERQKTCSVEWKEAKAAGKVEQGMKWPKFWSACNKRLKEAKAAS
jgi:hypothetical protein